MSPGNQPKNEPGNASESPLAGLTATGASQTQRDSVRLVLPQRALHAVKGFVVDRQENAQDSLVELPSSFRTSKQGREALKTVMFESLVSDLSAYARRGHLPQGSRERLTVLASLMLGKEEATDHEIRQAVTQAAASMQPEIAKCSKKIYKSIARLSPTSAVPSAKAAVSLTEETIRSLCELRALSWLAPNSISHSSFCDGGQPAAAALCVILQRLFDTAAAKGSFEEADAAMRLQSDVLFLLRDGRLDKPQPSYLAPLPLPPTGSAATRQASVAALLRGGGGLGGLSPFAAPLRLSLPTSVTEQRCALKSLIEAKGWKTEDESPTHELLEGLIDALPLAAAELPSFDPINSSVFPSGAASVVSILSRLRYQENREGLIAFATVFGPPVDNSRLADSAEYYAQQHTTSWMQLVKMASSWPQRSAPERQDAWEDTGLELKAAVARGLWMVCVTFVVSASNMLKDRHLASSPGVIGLKRDVQNLRGGAQALADHLGISPIADVMRKLVDELAPSLIRALDALELVDDSTVGLLEKAKSLPTSFGDNDLEKDLKAFCEHVRTTAAESSVAESNAALDSLSTSFIQGDPEAFSEELERFLALAAAAPEGSTIRTQHLETADHFARNYINLITEAFGSEIASDSPTEKKVESLCEQLWHFALVREIIDRRADVIGYSRLNHINFQITEALNAHPQASAKLLEQLCDAASASKMPSAQKVAALLAKTTGCMRRLAVQAPELVARFRATRAGVS